MHLRSDKSVAVDGRLLPALCVYSGNLIRFEEGRSRLEQFLDQTTTYGGSYLALAASHQPNVSRVPRPRAPSPAEPNSS